MNYTIVNTTPEVLEKKIYKLLNKHQKETTNHDNPEMDFTYAVQVDNQIIGGIIARLWHSEMHISLLALEKDYRGKGIAKQLIEKVEQNAVSNNATIITITTQDFQAPGLYEKLGYITFATLPDCPFEGTTRYYLCKRI